MTFIYTVNRVGRSVSVVTAGELDVTAAGPFGAMLCRLARSEPPGVIEIDLGGLRFIDSTGVAALNRAYRAASRTGGVLVAVNATGLVRRVLELTGALDHLHLSPGATPDRNRPPVASDTGHPPA